MANLLDEEDVTLERPEGKDVHVVAKQLQVEKPGGSVIIPILLFVAFIIPGIIYLVKKAKMKQYFKQLEQRLQHAASTVDNYLEQRVVILSNAAKLVEKAVSLDKGTFEAIAQARSGKAGNGEEMSQIEAATNVVERNINVAMENYPELKAHQEIADAMQQNSYLQREITAAREQYNDVVNQWNREINEWFIKQQVAYKEQYTTRIPFIASKEIKDKARDVFF